MWIIQWWTFGLVFVLIWLTMIIEQAWKNISKENARMLFVLVPSEPIINQATGEEYELTSTKHLEE